MLDTAIEPLIIREVENQRDTNGNLFLDEHLLHFQQVGAPPHYVHPVIEWLDNHYPEQWIGRKDTTWGHQILHRWIFSYGAT